MKRQNLKLIGIGIVVGIFIFLSFLAAISILEELLENKFLSMILILLIILGITLVLANKCLDNPRLGLWINFGNKQRIKKLENIDKDDLYQLISLLIQSKDIDQLLPIFEGDITKHGLEKNISVTIQYKYISINNEVVDMPKTIEDLLIYCNQA